MTRDELKSILAQPEKADALAADPLQRRVTVDAMLAHIGDPDPALRDEGIYLTVVRWVTEERLPHDELSSLLPIIVDDAHLFYQQGEVDGDGIFTRSFSLLWIPLLLYVHQDSPIFSSTDIVRLKEAVLRYIGGEADRRGYVPDKGWAHAIAHCADVLQWLARCHEFTRIDLLELLDTIGQLATAASPVYIDDEEVRLCVATIALLERNLLRVADWEAWLAHQVALLRSGTTMPTDRARVTNFRRFLNSCYVALSIPDEEAGGPLEIRTALRTAVGETIVMLLKLPDDE